MIEAQDRNWERGLRLILFGLISLVVMSMATWFAWKFRVALITPWGAGSLNPLLWTSRENISFQEMKILQGSLHESVWYYVSPEWGIAQYRSKNSDWISSDESVVYHALYLPTWGDVRITELYGECAQKMEAAGIASYWIDTEDNDVGVAPTSPHSSGLAMLNFIDAGVCGEYLDEVSLYMLGFVPAENTLWDFIYRYHMELRWGTKGYAFMTMKTLPDGVTPEVLSIGESFDSPLGTYTFVGVESIGGETVNLLESHGSASPSMHGPYIAIVSMPELADYNPFPITEEDATLKVEIIAVYEPVP